MLFKFGSLNFGQETAVSFYQVMDYKSYLQLMFNSKSVLLPKLSFPFCAILMYTPPLKIQTPNHQYEYKKTKMSTSEQ